MAGSICQVLPVENFSVSVDIVAEPRHVVDVLP